MISEGLKIYPVPAGNNLELKICPSTGSGAATAQGFKMNITNSLGQMIREEEIVFKE